MSQHLNDLIAGASLLGAYVGVCAAVFNHKAGDKLPLGKYVVGGAIALGGMTALVSAAVAAEPAEKTAVSAVAAPALKP